MAALDAYDELLETALKPFVETSGKIDGDVKGLAEHVEKAFRAQREFIDASTRFAKPDDKVFGELLKPTADAIQACTKYIDTTLKRSKPRTDAVSHLQAINNSIAALGWVTVSPAPTPFVVESGLNAAQFYLNKVLKDAKDESHKTWCKQVTKIWQDLADYVKAHHRTGVSWNARGEKLTDARAAHAGAAGAGAPPPPPPPGALPPPPPPPASDPDASMAAAKSQLFAQIGVGASVTSGLKKVEDKDRVCKNPALRATSKVPELKSSVAASSSKLSGPGRGSGPAVFELRNDKEWRVENQSGADLTVDAARAQRNHTAYVYRCENTIIRIPAKVNIIQIDSCKKVKLFVDEVIASIDVVNSASIEVHVLVKGRLINIDKTDGAQVFLLAKNKTKEAQLSLEEIEIVTSKTSTVNICTPDTKPDAADGDYVESAVAEQFRTTKKMVEKTDKSGVKQLVAVWQTEPFDSVG